jgi:thymidine kinase
VLAAPPFCVFLCADNLAAWPSPLPLPQAQFFADLKDFCVETADKHHKTVLVAGLDGDFRRESFGQVRGVAAAAALCASVRMLPRTARVTTPHASAAQVLALVPHADVVTKKVGRCQRCQRPSLFSLRTVAGARPAFAQLCMLSRNV